MSYLPISVLVVIVQVNALPTFLCCIQVDASSISGCSTDSDEDSAVDIPALRPPVFRRAAARTAPGLTLGSPPGGQHSIQVQQARAAVGSDLHIKTSPSPPPINATLCSGEVVSSRPSLSSRVRDEHDKENR